MLCWRVSASWPFRRWPASADAASTTWRLQPTPANHGAALDAVSCVSSQHCLAVGGGHVRGWSGSTWSVLQIPRGAAALNGVACLSTTDCIVVGQATSGLAQAWSWNGHRWKDQPTYNPGSTDNVLSGIRCAGSTSCEAVGTHGTQNGATYPLAEFWNGATWEDQSTRGAPAGALASVACESTSNCQAVGQTSSQVTLAMGWNGSTWVTETTPRLHPLYGSPSELNEYAFTGVSCYSGGCTAVGWHFYCDCSPEASGDVTLAEAWNGTKWEVQSHQGSGEPSSPAPATDAFWQAVHCTDASSCTAVGAWTDDNEAQPMFTLADTWNGTSWAVNKTPSPGSSGANSFPGDLLNGLSCTSGTCTAVGYQSSDSSSGNSLAMRN